MQKYALKGNFLIQRLIKYEFKAPNTKLASASRGRKVTDRFGQGRAQFCQTKIAVSQESPFIHS